MPQTKPIVSVENVVASASVDQKMDLNELDRTKDGLESKVNRIRTAIRMIDSTIKNKK